MIELFRKEVLERRGSRLLGEINLALPVGWQLLGYLFAAAVIAAVVFLSFASYTRFETVQGSVVPDGGVAAVVPSRGGVVTELYVADGRTVAAGQPIAKVKVSEILASGGASSDQLSAAILAQEKGLASQTSAQSRVARVGEVRGLGQVRGLERELRELAEQLAIQSQLVVSAQEYLQRAGELAKSGYISRRDILVREETLMIRRQQLAQLEQTRAGKEAALADARRAVAQLGAQAAVEEASARMRLGELGRQRVDAAAAEGYLVTAPVKGTVTAVAARVGQTVETSSPLLLILPTGSSLRAELSVPARSIGYIRPGQDVQVTIDGFPVERFGSMRAKVLTVPAAPVLRRDPQGNMVSVYPVTCELRGSEFVSRGQRYQLVAGMTLNARIATLNQPLLKWLVEPLLTVAR